MNIHKLLSTKERIKILKYLLYKTDHLSVNRIANELRLSKGLISKFLNILSKEKIVKRKNNKFLIKDNLNTKAIKILLNLNNFDTKIFNKYKFISSAGLFGSLVKGKNTEESDIDLWILIEKTKEKNLAKLTNELKRRYTNIKPLYLTKDKLKTLRNEDTVFYYSLVFGSITVYGEEIETI